MKRLLLLLLFFPVVTVFSQQSPERVPRTFTPVQDLSPADYLPNTVIVKFKKEASAKQIRAVTGDRANGIKVMSSGLKDARQLFKNSLTSSLRSIRKSPVKDTIGLDRIYELKFSGEVPLETIVDDLLTNPAIEYAEPSYIYHTSYIPSDPYFNSQNHLRQIGADRAWDLIRNSAGLVIAIVDSGTDIQHEDLRSNLILPGKDLVGASFSTMIEDDDPDVTSDSTDHGVRVSGIIAGISDNGIGIASAGFNARLLVVKAGADDNATAIYKGYEGIKYAADHGADIINCSWGGPGGGAYGQDIINYALSRGCMIVAAAGNGNTMEADYPANYEGVMAVASVDANDRKSGFSNYGRFVDISAPGEILTTANRNNYIVARGTSFSTPLVASAAALVKSMIPEFDMSQVQEQIRVTADNIDNQNLNYRGLLGKGRLNLFRAVTERPPSIRKENITFADGGTGSFPPGDTMRIFFDVKNFLSPASGLRLTLSSLNPNVEIIDGGAEIGSLGTMEIKASVGPFLVFIKPGIPDNEEVAFKISYTADGAYQDTEDFVIRLARDYMDIAVNQILTTISSNGRVGFSGPEATEGKGLVYKNRQLLYEAALMIGYSAEKLSNNARNDFGSYDEDFVKRVTVTRVTDTDAAFKAMSEFDDSGSDQPLDIYVRHSQTAYAAEPDDKYTIVEYEIKNSGDAALTDLYAGMFTDWDVDASAEITSYDSPNRLAYVYGKDGDGSYAGLKLLSANMRLAYYPMSHQLTGDPLQTGGGLSRAEKYESLSSGIKATSLGNRPTDSFDVAFVGGYGPFTIPVNGSVNIAFAFLAGDDFGDITVSAQAAQNKYQLMRGGTPVGSETELVLAQNFPNPSGGYTRIMFSVPGEGYTQLALYDLLGRKVKDLVNSTLTRGSYTIEADLSDVSSGIYVYRIQFQDKQKSRKLIVSK